MDLWDDTYDGPRWRYGLTLRPFGPYMPRDGLILGSWDRDGRFAFGTVAYARPLTQFQVDQFSLVQVNLIA